VDTRSVETGFLRGLRYANVSLTHSGVDTVRNYSARTQVVYALCSRCIVVVHLKYYHLLLDAVECTSLNTECVMEIHGLLPFILKFCKKRNLRDLSGQTAAINASC